MMREPFTPRHVVITAHPKLPAALNVAEQIANALKEKGFDAPHGSLYDEALRRRVRHGDFDALIAVGGDGTMLRAAHLCAPMGIPVLGINEGRLGFLFQIHPDGWQPMLEDFLRGDGWVEHRMMLRAEHLRSGESLGAWHALNDIVVGRGQYLRPVHITASADGQFLTQFVADGLIASTATGSTAYALAAGGPILPPELRNILLVPLAPHLSVDRPVIFSEGSTVSMTIHSENAVLSVDGQLPVALAEEDRVDVRAGDYEARFIRFGDPGYFYRNLTAHMNQNRSIVGLPR